jgi:hypothetical protein
MTTQLPQLDPLHALLATQLTRRRLLSVALGSAVAAATGVACSDSEVEEPAVSGLEPLAQDDPRLRQFLTLSSLITGVGVDKLDPELGARLYPAVEYGTGEGVSIADLARAAGVTAGSPGTQSSLEAAFAEPAAEAKARLIATCWYSGQEPASGDKPGASLAYGAALGWRALDFTTPPGTCGGAFGSWSEAPAT